MVVETNGRAMARREDAQAMALATWNAEQTNVIRTLICPGASDAELVLFAQVCQQTGLNPFARQIYGIMRFDGRQRREVLSIQTSIDGFRLAAQRSGQYGGQTDTEWCGEDGAWREVWLSSEPPAAARVGVIRKGWERPVQAVATFAEYCQRTKDGNPSGMWGKMPAVMLAKCAEALALRKAFPAELSGLYSSDEMAQADNPLPTFAPDPPVVTVEMNPDAVDVPPPSWLVTFEAQWAKGAAIAEEIGATLPEKRDGSKLLAQSSIKALQQAIETRREELALLDSMQPDEDAVQDDEAL